MSIGSDGFKWFIGTVEKGKDPLELGRVRVRVHNEHDQNFNVEDLPWAQILSSTISASINGIGLSPTGFEFGTNVIGFYIDSNSKQFPMILGSFHTIPDMDPKKHGVSELARGINLSKEKEDEVEPDSPYKSEYPYNKTFTTSSGHVIEIDDTPNAERIHVLHKSGSYIEMDQEGNMTIKSKNDQYNIVGGDSTISIKGDLNLQVKGDLNTVVDGDYNLVTSGNLNISSSNNLRIESIEDIELETGAGITAKAPGGLVMPEGSITTVGALSSGVGVTGAFSTPTGSTVHVQNGIITNIE